MPREWKKALIAVWIVGCYVMLSGCAPGGCSKGGGGAATPAAGTDAATSLTLPPDGGALSGATPLIDGTQNAGDLIKLPDGGAVPQAGIGNVTDSVAQGPTGGVFTSPLDKNRPNGPILDSVKKPAGPIPTQVASIPKPERPIKPPGVPTGPIKPPVSTKPPVSLKPPVSTKPPVSIKPNVPVEPQVIVSKAQPPRNIVEGWRQQFLEHETKLSGVPAAQRFKEAEATKRVIYDTGKLVEEMTPYVQARVLTGPFYPFVEKWVAQHKQSIQEVNRALTAPVGKIVEMGAGVLIK